MKDFYPTPVNLISKMLEDVKFDEIKYILEPSAGKGDICDYIIDKKKYINRDINIDVIEIEEDLQFILKGKNYNLVFNDFLQFNTFKKYDLIVANFPFSEGDKHLRKALDLIRDGGNLICLVNAETIKNPYTNLRKECIKILEKHDASIEYLQDQFITAERKTGVEVALIKLSIEDKKSTIILEKLKEAKNIEIDDTFNTQIVDKNPIKSLVQRFDFESNIGLKIINEYFTLRPFLNDDIKSEYKHPIIKLDIKDKYAQTQSDYINGFLESLREKYWRLLIRNENFRNNFTSNLISELENKLTHLRGYDFNEYNIKELEKELGLKINTNIEDTILKLFDEFSYQHAYGDEFNSNIHYYNGWKTNTAHKINKKVIIPVYFMSWNKNEFDHWKIKDKMNDIVKVFNYLSNEISDVPQLVGEVTQRAVNFDNYKKINYHYFTATLYKKGTCHIEFLDEKLLDKFNIFGCQKKGWLPPSYAKKKYNDMTEEEKQTIDDFQGKDKYDEVINDKDYYLTEFNNKLLLN